MGVGAAGGEVCSAEGKLTIDSVLARLGLSDYAQIFSNEQIDVDALVSSFSLSFF